jgi:hypothetical protein
MKQSYASAGKAPRRRVHSPSGIVAIAVCGLPPPRIVIGYRASKRSQVPNPVFASVLCVQDGAALRLLEMLARRRRQGTHLPAMVQLAERRRGQAPAAKYQFGVRYRFVSIRGPVQGRVLTGGAENAANFFRSSAGAGLLDRLLVLLFGPDWDRS